MVIRRRRPGSSSIWNAALLLSAVLMGGTAGYLFLGLGMVDAIYQTIITISTVGFREIHQGDPSTAWKIFTSSLILVGVGAMLYAATAIIESVVEGRITGQYRRYRMQRNVDSMSGHLIVCGMGKVGRSITSFVQTVGQDVVAIDLQDNRLESAGLPFVHGDATNDDVLRQAGVKRAATLITALGSNVDNLYVTLSARDLNPDLFIVSRADQSTSITKLHQVGANRVVNPYEIGGYRMASLATQPNVADFVDVVVHDGEFEAKLREIRVDDGCDFIGRTIDELDVRGATGAVVLTVRDPASHFHTDDLGRRPFGEGAVIVAIGSDESLDRLADLARC